VPGFSLRCVFILGFILLVGLDSRQRLLVYGSRMKCVFAECKRDSKYVPRELVGTAKRRKVYTTKGRESKCTAMASVRVHLQRTQHVDTAGVVASTVSVIVELELPRTHAGHLPKSLTDMSRCAEVFPMTAVAFIKVLSDFYFTYAWSIRH
jgi:hypothetical protein